MWPHFIAVIFTVVTLLNSGNCFIALVWVEELCCEDTLPSTPLYSTLGRKVLLVSGCWNLVLLDLSYSSQTNAILEILLFRWITQINLRAAKWGGSPSVELQNVQMLSSDELGVIKSQKWSLQFSNCFINEEKKARMGWTWPSVYSGDKPTHRYKIRIQNHFPTVLLVWKTLSDSCKSVP